MFCKEMCVKLARSGLLGWAGDASTRTTFLHTNGAKNVCRNTAEKKIRRAKRKHLKELIYVVIILLFFSTSSAISASHVGVRFHLQATMLQAICIGNYVARGDLCVTGNRKE